MAAIASNKSSTNQLSSPPKHLQMQQEETKNFETSNRVATVAERMSEHEDGDASPKALAAAGEN